MEFESAVLEAWMWPPFEDLSRCGYGDLSLDIDGAYRLSVQLKEGAGEKVACVDVVDGALRVLDSQGLIIYGAGVSAEVDPNSLRARLDGNRLVVRARRRLPRRRVVLLTKPTEPCWHAPIRRAA